MAKPAKPNLLTLADLARRNNGKTSRGIVCVGTAEGLIDRLRQKVGAAAGGRRRSKLWRAMRSRPDDFLRLIEEAGSDWTALAEAFAAEGLTDAQGKPPSPATARKTWHRVRMAVLRAPQRGASPREAVIPDDVVVVEQPPEVRPGSIEDVRRQLAKRSGREV